MKISEKPLIIKAKSLNHNLPELIQKALWRHSKTRFINNLSYNYTLKNNKIELNLKTYYMFSNVII